MKKVDLFELFFNNSMNGGIDNDAYLNELMNEGKIIKIEGVYGYYWA